jgi:soluble lytic murein transglycosylase-like protein
MKKAILIFTVCFAIMLIIFSVNAAPSEPMVDVVYTEAETTETHTEETITTAITEAVTEPSVSVLETTQATIPLYNVKLSTEVQECIITECGKYNIPPEIIIAMIERESRFNANAIGDNGNSFGLMQIQPRWHSQRMAKLGCTDLLNPIQNVKVGIDYLGELYNRYGSIEKALVAYNKGSYTGTITNYATSIMARANEVCYG